MKSVVVFCGSSKGHHLLYSEKARELGEALVKRKIWMVYGAGNVGLMGVIADAMLAKDGKVIGVIPHFLREKEVCHEGLTELYVVDSMHERKVKMAELSEGVIVMPGGYGTLDELFEMLTLVQLGQDDQPIGILNVNGFFTPLLNQLDHMMAEGFLKSFHRELILVSEEVEDLIDQMSNYEGKPVTGKWW